MNSRLLSSSIVFSLAGLLMAGCGPSTDGSDDSEQIDHLSATEINEDNAAEVVVAFFEREGLFSGSYFHRALVAAERAYIMAPRDNEGPLPPLPDDYATAETLNDPNTRVRMSVDGDGNIIPNLEWRTENSQYCLEQGKYMRPPLYDLQVEFHPETEEVFIRLVDIEAGVTEKMGAGRGDGDDWVDEAITEAWNQSTIPEVQKAASPCGDDIQLTLVLESEVTADAHATEVSRVKARIPMGAGQDTGQFIGSSSLVLKEYDKGFDLPPELSCNTILVPGGITAEAQIPDGNFDPDSASNFYENLDVTLRIPVEDAPRITRECVGPAGSTSPEQGVVWLQWFSVLNGAGTEEFTFFYPGEDVLGFWDPLEDDAHGLAEVTIDQSESFTDEGDTITLSEETTLIIRTEVMPPLK